MTARVITPLPLRAIRDPRLAGLAGVVAPHLAAAGWGLAASAVWGSALRVASLRQPVLVLLIASSALGFRLGTRG